MLARNEERLEVETYLVQAVFCLRILGNKVIKRYKDNEKETKNFSHANKTELSEQRY